MNLDARERAVMARRNIQFTDGIAKIGSKHFDGMKATVLLEQNWMNINKQYFSVRVLFDDLTSKTICTRARLLRALEIADSFLK